MFNSEQNLNPIVQFHNNEHIIQERIEDIESINYINEYRGGDQVFGKDEEKRVGHSEQDKKEMIADQDNVHNLRNSTHNFKETIEKKKRENKNLRKKKYIRKIIKRYYRIGKNGQRYEIKPKTSNPRVLHVAKITGKPDLALKVPNMINIIHKPEFVRVPNVVHTADIPDMKRLPNLGNTADNPDMIMVPNLVNTANNPELVYIKNNENVAQNRVFHDIPNQINATHILDKQREKAPDISDNITNILNKRLETGESIKTLHDSNEVKEVKLFNLKKLMSTVLPEYKTINRSQGCQRYNKEGTPSFHKSRQVLHFWGKDAINADDITLVTQMSRNRLGMLQKVARHWHGPISVAMVITHTEATTMADVLGDDSVYNDILQRNNIDLHFVIEKGVCSNLFVA